MKYTTEIIVNVPLKEFIKKLDNPENMKHWQRGLIDYDHISGTPGEIGSKMRLIYKMGKREMELIETITFQDFPHAFHVTYDTKGMHNLQENFFEEIDENRTKWTSKSEFLPTNFMLRMMTLIMPSAFKKQSKKYLEDFKNFAEKGVSVAQKNK
ncbi:SRPBCC family protein [Hanstruepera ponticola]|uniref:SRPBCC family protein n=1 Tax=Hanstruepera ponticola TaxID=2042995 RepID=UPI000CF15254|nr:SRPBCC family protein [Hanstruepera ponticola]